MSDVILKNPQQLALMRHAGQLLTQVFAHLDGFIRPGVSTLQINDRADAFIVEVLKARPASKGQYGFAYSLNTSVDHVVCHGVPSAQQVLAAGSIINVDITLEHGGYIADSSKMYAVDAIGDAAQHLVDTTYAALWEGIRQVRPGATLGDVGHAIQRHAEAAGYSVVREYCGHGIGRQMHEAPQVLHYGHKGSGLVLRPGMVFTIEPGLYIAPGAATAEKWWGLAVRIEDNILVTSEGAENMTAACVKSLTDIEQLMRQNSA